MSQTVAEAAASYRKRIAERNKRWEAALREIDAKGCELGGGWCAHKAANALATQHQESGE